MVSQLAATDTNNQLPCHMLLNGVHRPHLEKCPDIVIVYNNRMAKHGTASAQGKTSTKAKQTHRNRKTPIITITICVGAALAVLLLYQLLLSMNLPLNGHPPATDHETKADGSTPAANVTSQPPRAKKHKEGLQSRMAAELLHQKEEHIGNKTYHPSFGIFPKGCKWRLITTEGSDEAEYQWWDNPTKSWVDERPEACSPTGFNQETAPEGWDFRNNTPRTEVIWPKH